MKRETREVLGVVAGIASSALLGSAACPVCGRSGPAAQAPGAKRRAAGREVVIDVAKGNYAVR